MRLLAPSKEKHEREEQLEGDWVGSLLFLSRGLSPTGFCFFWLFNTIFEQLVAVSDPKKKGNRRTREFSSPILSYPLARDLEGSRNKNDSHLTKGVANQFTTCPSDR